MQHPRHRHRMPVRQPDLFGTIPPPTSDPTPGWSSLPDRTRQAVTSLVTRLLTPIFALQHPPAHRFH